MSITSPSPARKSPFLPSPSPAQFEEPEPEPSEVQILSSLRSPSQDKLGFWVCYRFKPSQPGMIFLTQDSFSLGQLYTLWHNNKLVNMGPIRSRLVIISPNRTTFLLSQSPAHLGNPISIQVQGELSYIPNTLEPKPSKAQFLSLLLRQVSPAWKFCLKPAPARASPISCVQAIVIPWGLSSLPIW